MSAPEDLLADLPVAELPAGLAASARRRGVAWRRRQVGLGLLGVSLLAAGTLVTVVSDTSPDVLQPAAVAPVPVEIGLQEWVDRFTASAPPQAVLPPAPTNLPLELPTVVGSELVNAEISATSIGGPVSPQDSEVFRTVGAREEGVEQGWPVGVTVGVIERISPVGDLPGYQQLLVQVGGDWFFNVITNNPAEVDLERLRQWVRDVLEPIPYDPAEAPPEFRDRPALPSCGSYALGQAQPLPATPLACLRAAIGSETGAELAVRRPTIEGQPIVTYVRALPDASEVELWTDSTFDPMSTQVWSRALCGDVDEYAGPLACTSRDLQVGFVSSEQARAAVEAVTSLPADAIAQLGTPADLSLGRVGDEQVVPLDADRVVWAFTYDRANDGSSFASRIPPGGAPPALPAGGTCRTEVLADAVTGAYLTEFTSCDTG